MEFSGGSMAKGFRILLKKCNKKRVPVTAIRLRDCEMTDSLVTEISNLSPEIVVLDRCTRIEYLGSMVPTSQIGSEVTTWEKISPFILETVAVSSIASTPNPVVSTPIIQEAQSPLPSWFLLIRYRFLVIPAETVPQRFLRRVRYHRQPLRRR